MLSDYLLTQNIIGSAIEVHKALGPGFLESIYDHALRFEFQKRNIPLLINFVTTPLTVRRVYREKKT